MVHGTFTELKAVPYCLLTWKLFHGSRLETLIIVMRAVTYYLLSRYRYLYLLTHHCKYCYVKQVGNVI